MGDYKNMLSYIFTVLRLFGVLNLFCLVLAICGLYDAKLSEKSTGRLVPGGH